MKAKSEALPPLFDRHIHGFAGVDALEADVAGFRKMAKKLGEAGTGRFLATMYPAPLAILARQMRRAREAGIFGVHLEGPFVNPIRAGGLDPKQILAPSRSAMKKILTAGKGVLKKMTIAPELSGSLDLIAMLRDAGVVASMGHSEATFSEARLGASAGASAVTHLFNAMRPIHHREPGLAGYALLDPEIECELIADLVHVSAPMVELVFRCHEKTVLISDCLKCGGTKTKFFTAGGAKHEVRKGAAYLAGTKTLSGAGTSLAENVRRLLKAGILAPEQIRANLA